MAWSQQDLAKAAGVATSTVADFERGQRTPVANNAQAIRGALEGAGIRFLPTGAVIGPAAPRVAPSERPGAPIRWVNAEDLSGWANRTDCAVSLPTLLAHLIRATHGTAVELRFPSDEGVRHSGWDGRTSTEIGSVYVPLGNAGWEISSQRSNIAQKATEDYRKRTLAPAPLDPADSTYVFVTPRHWPKKDEWAKARKEEGAWREVRAYDADFLVHWIEQMPAVGLWLATRLEKRPAGTRELEDVWEEWSLATKWPLTEDLVLSDRDEDAVEVLRWLRGEPSVLSIQATSTDEVVAFFHATLSMLPDNMAAAYRARCLVTTTTAAARALDLWNLVPGTCEDGTIDREALEAWIKEARSLAKAVGRQDIADDRIGNMLSAAPAGADGNWPAEAVREVIDVFRSKPMIEGFVIGKGNRRGVTTRAPRDGGNLERQEAAKYRSWAKAIAFEHPHTAKALDTLANRYENEARRHDEDAERRDWES